VPLDCAPQQVASPGGWSSCNLVWLGRVPIPGLTIGGRLVGSRFFVSNWTTGWHAFDVSDPENPTLQGRLTIDGATGSTVTSAVENEDPATNGRVAIVSRTAYRDALVIDTSNPTAPRGLAAVAGAQAHTYTCLNDCQWAYGSDTGTIVDLRDPAHPVLLPYTWLSRVGVDKAHDLTEVRPGLAISASDPAVVMDTSNPAEPKVLFRLPQSAAVSPPLGLPGPAQSGRIGHNNLWPRQGEDRFFLGLSEGPYDGRCELYPEEGRTLYVYDTTGWKQKRTFAPLSQYTLVSGNADTGLAGGPALVDSHGNPSALELAVQGCSVHWFDVHPSFQDGGLVALSSFSHGMRLLNVRGDGRIEQLGYYVSSGTAGLAATVDVRWISDRVFYVMDVASGSMDLVKYTGPLPRRGPLATAAAR
jgi:hypothetical protein